MTIPDGDGATTIAPFVNVLQNDGSPRIQGSMGLGCPVDEQPLHAQADRYPQPTMTDVQTQLFRGRENYTTMVNAALQDLQDVSLQAEVYRYRAGLDMLRDGLDLHIDSLRADVAESLQRTARLILITNTLVASLPLDSQFTLYPNL
jgi:hypothetical protein